LQQRDRFLIAFFIRFETTIYNLIDKPKKAKPVNATEIRPIKVSAREIIKA
jgi:hypothetical protein